MFHDALLFRSTYNNCHSRLGRAKSHIIFCDTDLNTIPGVYLNAYQNFLVIAMRMHHYLRSWGANIRKNLKFIHSMPRLFLTDCSRIIMNFPYSGTIQQVVRYTYAVMRSKALNKVSTAQGGKCDVEKTCITWSVFDVLRFLHPCDGTEFLGIVGWV